MKKILAICLFAQYLTAAPYQWGVYKPVDFNGKNQIIIVDWFSKEGKKRLSRSQYNNDFYQLAHMYQPQINPVFAGVATSVVILNALRLPQHNVQSQPEIQIKQPKALGGEIIPFPAFSQLTFLNEETDKIKNRKIVALQNVTPENENDKSQFKPGTSLSELKAFLGVHGANLEIILADKPEAEGLKLFRKTLKEVLKDESQFLLSNFKGDTFGASTGGTVSPLAAYDEKSDSVLILDVTGHKNPWYWIPAVALYRAMNTSYDNGIYRGYGIVSLK